MGDADVLDGLDVTRPAEVADLLNRLFPFDTATEQFATLMYGVVDAATGDFRCVSAGHPGPLHLPAGAPPVILEKPGFPIGLANEPYGERCIHLPRGNDSPLSDGIPSDELPQRAVRRRPAPRAPRTREGPAAPGRHRLPAGRDRAWQGGAKPQDDISILAIEVAAAPRP